MADRVHQGTGGAEPEAVRPGAITALLEEIAAAPEAARGGAWEGSLRAGAVVGRFELVRELGRGGFGVVWEARDRELGRSVAFKAVRAGGRELAREARLQEEAEAAARLQHPNIVTLHDVGRAGEGPYLVLELLRGETLDRRLQQGPLPVAEAVRVAAEVARGLEHAHARGVVHRDLKPGNVFLCQDGQVKVLDFGLAHAFGRRRQEGGTPGYMAPEQTAGAPEDERTDVFALGVMLFEMLSGGLPFPDAKALASSGPAPRLETPEAPALGDLVGWMLAKEPVARPRDGKSVLEALGTIRDALARSPFSPAPVRVRRRLPKLAKVGLAALLLAAAAAGVLMLVPGLRVRHQADSQAEAGAVAASIAVLPFADASPDHDQGTLADGMAEAILNALAQVEGLRVAGRTSSFFFKGKDVRLAEIGRELRVAHVLEGSVQKSGSRARVVAAVVRVADGRRLWTETFDREPTDLFAVQDEIARAVAESLRVKLVRPRARGGAVAGPEALAQFLRGRDLVRSGGMDGMRSAATAFERAISLDPSFALAWVGLSQALMWIECMAGEGFSAERRRQALAAANRAIELAPDLPQGYVQRSNLRLNFVFDWKGALADAESALSLGPGDADAILLHAWLLAALGASGQAAIEAERAAELDPLQADAWVLLGLSRMNAGDHQRARAALERALEIKPRGELARLNLVVGWMAAARPDAALAVARQASLPWIRLFGTALAQHDLGHPSESQAALDELVARNARDCAYQIAGVHAWRGESEPAFAWLERARRQGDPGIVYLKYDVLLRAIRRDPRFAKLLRELGLPPD